MSPKLIKVLLVEEDDPGDAPWIKTLLAKAGNSLCRFELHHFTSISEALQHVNTEASDAILLDLGLPDNLGTSALQRVLDAVPRVPVVVLTASPDEEFGAAVVQQGAQDYLTKSKLNQDGLVRSLCYAVERHQTKSALQESEERLRLAIDAAFRVSFEWDIRRNEVRRFMSLDPALPPTAKQEPSSFEAVCEVVHPEDRELFTANVRAALDRADGRYENEYRVVHPDGQVAWLSERGVVERDTQGRPARLIGLAQDITERKRAEEASKTAHREAVHEKKRLEAVMESLPVGVAILDDRGGNIRSNRMFEQVWGAPRPLTREVNDYAAYKAWWVDTGTPVKPEDWASACVVKKGEAVIGQYLEIERFDGQHRFVLNSAAPILDADGKVNECAVAILDITELQEAKEALRASEEKYRKLVEHASSIILRVDPQGRITYMNEYGERFFGYSKEEILGRHIVGTLVPPKGESGRDLEAMVRDIIASPDRYVTNDHEMITRSGARVWVRWTNQAVLDEAGRVVEIMSIGLDSTGHKRAEEALEESERRYRTLVELSPEAVAVHQDGRYVFVNQAGARLFGATNPEEILGKRVLDLVPPDYRDLVLNRIKKARRGEQTELREIKICRLDGTAVDVEATGRYISYQGKPAVLILMRDITERKRAEDTLRRSKERLDLLAETASQLLASVSPQRVVDSICPGVMAFLECDVFFNFLVDEREGCLHLNACAGIPAEEAQRIEWLDYGAAVCGCVAREACRIVSEDILQTDDLRTALVKSYGIQAYACHPLMVGGRVLGTLSFGTRTRSSFTAEELDLMKAVADQVAIAMDRKLAEEALRQLNEELEQRIRERTAELERSNAAIKKSEEDLRYLTAQIIAAQEQERKRIARELHEGLAQSMTTLKLYLRTLQRHLPPGEKSIKADFDTTQNLLREMVDDVRRISQGLSPVLLEDLGLAAACEYLLAELGKLENVTINTDIDGIKHLFAPQTEINVFRVFQESLHNIARHAQATQVSVAIKRYNGRVDFCIRDNGVGFDLQQITGKKSAKKGLGLAAMEERLRMSGSQLHIDSHPGRGTAISFSIRIIEAK
jgi:PAS domain S-box-containing protein